MYCNIPKLKATTLFAEDLRHSESEAVTFAYRGPFEL
jgi:hypothetical protein